MLTSALQAAQVDYSTQPMSPPSSTQTGVRALAPRARIAALDDAHAPQWLDEWRPSPHLADRGMEAQDDDGVVTARIRIEGEPWLVAAQDERFLGGSVGAEHAKALRALCTRACAERPAGLALLAASGGVRLHEANAAELELARALRAMFAVRQAGIRTAAVAVGHLFGGACVLACATDRLGTLPGVRVGLSGPKVVETACGRGELDAADPAAVDALYGAAVRVRDGHAYAVDDDPAAIRQSLHRTTASALTDAIASSPGAPNPVDLAPLDAAWNARPVGAGLWRSPQAWIVAPFGAHHVDAASVRALDRALLAHLAPGGASPGCAIVLEDSPGHAVSRAAEQGFLSRDLARHAGVLDVLRARGVRLVGALIGTGHSAAFFTNALQADVLCAVPAARVVAMDPAAIARVTGVDALRLIAHDRLLGQPVRHFAALGGVGSVLPDASPARILAFALQR